MLNEKNFDMAIACFERSGDAYMAKWAKAVSLREDGKRNLKTHKEIAKHSLTEAAKNFLSIGKPDYAADCFIIAGEYIKAGRIYLENFNGTRLEDAGDCFAEAKSWNEAAIAYARAKCVEKCLNACTKAKLFEMGLKLIQELKKENCKSNCGRCDTCQRVKIEVEFLRISATHFHHRKDTKSMMKFVKAFPTLDLVRSFLWNKGYFDELLRIEVANGDFVRAAEVAEMKGDLLLQADMLEKAEKYEEAIKTILFHVQLNSMWGMKNGGWPLRQFPEKNELLGKVKQIAIKSLHHVSKALDCKISILSNESHCNLSEKTEQMILAQKMGNLNFEALSLRKVLDVHICSAAKNFQHEQVGSLLEMNYNSKMLLETGISSITMVSLWNEWKGKLLSSVKSFTELEKRPEKEKDKDKDKAYIEFASEYFGARENRNRSCTVFNSESFWLKDRRVGSLQRQGNCTWISIQNFFMHARKFLLVELFSVGIKVVKKLEEIYLACNNQHCICKGTLILGIYQDLKSLKDGELVRFDQEQRFFEILSPLKTQYENMKEFISCVKVQHAV
ncbi:uncharacterized protein LOC131856266 [Cryptomeria japonica]|uniref:uncharacterized protein LOC131856266 n=1 Tax=Cryptomeria japonica TaxID=3369 RepID=UPI0027D9FBAE|nr:uncharacterized protein LOC131856266 [Cryptomeria japonica]